MCSPPRNLLLQTPAFLAAQNNHPSVLRFLKESGADVDLWDRDGFTPLAVAAYEGHADVCELLIELGARLDLVGGELLLASF